MITGLAHLCFIVEDLEPTISFYRDTLGLRLAFDFRNDKDEQYGVYFHAGARQFIEFFKSDAVQPCGPKQAFQHFCLEVDDIQLAVKELRGKGVEVTDPEYGRDHSWQAWLADPNGTRIELHQYTTKSLQVAAM